MSRHPIGLALQGGGSHGAYTWGVLDALLEADDLDIKAVTGTSAGAVNAALLAHGFAGRDGGPTKARAALRAFWERTGTLALFWPTAKPPEGYLPGIPFAEMWLDTAGDIVRALTSPEQPRPICR